MKSTLIFSSKQIVPHMKGVTRFEIIDELVEHLAANGKIVLTEKDAIALEVKKREKSMSTAIGFGFAVPHAHTWRLNEVAVAFGRSRQGIDFSALDNQPVKFVALIIVPSNERQQYLWLLNCIARSFHERDIRRQLENALDAEAIAAILNGRAAVS